MRYHATSFGVRKTNKQKTKGGNSSIKLSYLLPEHLYSFTAINSSCQVILILFRCIEKYKFSSTFIDQWSN